MTSPAPLPPPRSLISVQPVPAAEGGGVLLGCDCGTSTQLVIKGVSNLAHKTELAFTCTCGSSHWFTVAPFGGEQ